MVFNIPHIGTVCIEPYNFIICIILTCMFMSGLSMVMHKLNINVEFGKDQTYKRLYKTCLAILIILTLLVSVEII
mgnify:CR=1 FL=1